MTLPVMAAPMAGGPSAPGLVAAVAAADGFGFLAGGYLTPDALISQIETVRQSTEAFGVNLFAPPPVRVDPVEYRRYAETIAIEGERYGLDIAALQIREDDDYWDEKLDVLLTHPVPVVSFTFGIPDTAVVTRLRRAGTTVMQTVTSVAEARLAAAAGVDELVVQAGAAGGHSATMTPQTPAVAVPLPELVAAVVAVAKRPVVAAGGVATPRNVSDALAAGARAAMVGTVLLRCDESGASPAYQAALAQPNRGDPVLTRCFSGRPARALRNDFLERYDEAAPAGYPAIHHLTSPLRKAAAAAQDAERINLWAGNGYRAARAEPVSETLVRLSAAS